MKMAGYPVESSEQVPADTLIFGDWSSLIIALWGGLDVVVDLSTNVKSGGVVIRVFQSADIGSRHAAGFSKCTNFALS